MVRRYILHTAGLGLFIFLFIGQTAHAVLPPGAADELKSNAEEVLNVRILKVKTPKGNKGMYPVIYTAEVLGVNHTKSGIQKGNQITICSYSVNRETINSGFVGPKIPPLLKPGWTGIVYLKNNPEKNVYDIAAYGDSFQELKKEAGK